MIHLPLGLVLSAAFVEVVRTLQRKPGVSAFTPIALWIAAASACMAAGTGWLFAEGQSPSDELFWHRWLGIATAVGLLPLAVVATRVSRPGNANARQLAPMVRGGTVAAAVLVAWVGHLGGNMTWGSNFALRPLLEWGRGAPAPAPAPSPAPVPASATAPTVTPVATTVDFTREVLPLLQERCYECHGNGKRKGRLAMDDLASLRGQNGDGEWIVKPGEPDASLLLARVLLAADDDDAMPPEGDRLTADQVSALRRWIAEGASTEPNAAAPPTAAALASASAQASAPAQPSAADAAPAAARARPSVEPATVAFPSQPAPVPSGAALSAIATYRARGVIVQPISRRDGWLEFNASARGRAFVDADLAELAAIAPALVELNLSRTGVTDAGLQALPQLPHLAVVRVDGTAAADAGVQALIARAPNLQSVNLVDTRVSDTTAGQLSHLARLARVYLWGTAVTPEAVRVLRAAKPATLVDNGSDS
ncbi:MAG: hypothetical protein JNK53_08120 [Phycisphaerae bacterium]|nr:hypothetical protein [Phycisphaerae bacterium]